MMAQLLRLSPRFSPILPDSPRFSVILFAGPKPVPCHPAKGYKYDWLAGPIEQLNFEFRSHSQSEEQ